MTPNNFRVKNGLTVSNGVTIEAGGLTITGGITANGSLGAAGQSLTSNGTAVYWGAGGKSAGDGLQANDTHYSVNTTWFDARTATITSNNATYAFGKSEAGINANSALTANNASYVYGKQETQLNVNSATSASSANNAAYLGGVAAADYQLESGLAANVATLESNTALTANNATYAFGKTEGNINANSALTSNNATYLNGQLDTYYTNATNISSGTLAEARLPYRMNQNVRTTDTVEFTNLTITGNITVTGTQTILGGNTTAFTDNMVYLNNGISANITNIVGNGSVVIFTANNNFSAGWDVYVTGVDPSSYNGTYTNISAANATHFQVANTNTASYVSGGAARGKTDVNPDIGFAFGYNDGTYRHGGFFRDATDGVFKVFKNYTPEPDASIYIDTSNASFTIADLQANVVYAAALSANGSVGSNNNVLVSNGSGMYWGSVSGGIQYTTKTANYTAADKDGIIADTTAGAFTITLPSSPAAGAQVVIVDGADFYTNNLTVGRNGSTIESASEDLILDITGVSVTFIYSGTTWQVYTQVGAAAASPTYKIVSTTYSAAPRDNLVANTSGGSFTITLPASPSLGDEVTIADGASFETYPLTVARNGSTIEGLAENMVLDVPGIRTNFLYSGGTWQIFTQVGLGGLAYVDTANNASYLGGVAANGYALLANSVFTGPVSGITTLGAGNTTITGFANVSSTLAAGNTTITGFANVSTTLQVGANTATFGTAAYIVANGNMGFGNASPVDTISVNGTSYFGNTIDIAGPVKQAIVAVAALDINCSLGNYFTKTINGNSTFTFSNAPSSRVFAFTLELTHTSGSVTWPAAVKWPSDTAPTLTTGKTHLFMFITDDGGTRWRGAALADYVN